MKQIIKEVSTFKLRVRPYILGFLEWFLITVLSITCAIAFIGSSMILANFGYAGGVNISFHFFFFALIFGYGFSHIILTLGSNIGKHNLVFHFSFLVIVLNFVNIITFHQTFYTSYIVYVAISLIYICLVCFAGSRSSRIYHFIIIIFSLYTFSIILLNYESFLLFSNFVIYKASKRARWLRTGFPHITLSSILPAKRAVALYYKDYADTVFTWDYSIWTQIWFSSFVSIILFFFCYNIYARISVNIVGLGLGAYLLCSIFSIAVTMFAVYMFRIIILRIIMPLDLLAPLIDLYPFVSGIMMRLDYVSYVLFAGYATVLFLIFRFWLSVFRSLLLAIINRPFIIDFDYKSVMKLTRSAKTAMYWRFPRKWFTNFMAPRKKINRSKNVETSDDEEDGIYYYGGPNPHMVLFNSVTGEVRPIFIKDLTFENYKVYYKIYDFLRRRPRIVNLFPRIEFQSVMLPWFDEERHKHFKRVNRVPGLSFFYSTSYAAIDFKIHEWLMLLNPDQYEEYEESEKGFFDTQMWESVWYRDFGRKTPIGNNEDFNWLTTLSNPDFPYFNYKRPFRSKTEGNEYLYELAILRRRRLTQRSIWFSQNVGLRPNLIRYLGVKDGKGLNNNSILNFPFLLSYGVRNFIINSLFGQNDKSSIELSQLVQFKSLSAISKIRSWFFNQKPKFTFKRVIDEEFVPDDRATYFDRNASSKRELYLKILVETISHKFLQSELSLGLLKYIIKQNDNNGGINYLNFSFSECYKIKKYTYGWNAALKLIQSQNFRGYFFNKLFRYGFCGWSMNFLADVNLYKKIDLVPYPIFSLFNSVENSLIPTLSNFPIYSYLSKWKVEFSGFFEFPLYERFSRIAHGRLGRFRFVDPKIIFNNETSSKINYFFVNLKRWYLENKVPEIARFEMFYFIKIYKNFYKFFISKFVYLKYCSKLTTLLSTFQTFDTGLSLKPNVFEYKASFVACPPMHMKIVDPAFTYEPFFEKRYGYFPYNFFDYQLFFNYDKLFSQSRKIFPSSAISGSDREIPLRYLYTTTGSFYINSVISSNIYSQMFDAGLVQKYIKNFNFSKFRKYRFYSPTFYSLFDQGFSNSLLSYLSISSITFNSLQASYIKNLNSGVFIKNAKIFDLALSISYNYMDKGLGSLSISWFKSFFLFFSRRRFLLTQKIFYKNRFFKFFIFIPQQGFINSKKQISCSHRKYIYPRKWFYHWNSRLFFSPGKRARIMYYSQNKHPRFRSSSFTDRVDVFFLRNLMASSEKRVNSYLEYGSTSDFLFNFLVGPNTQSFFHFWLKRLYIYI